MLRFPVTYDGEQTLRAQLSSSGVRQPGGCRFRPRRPAHLARELLIERNREPRDAHTAILLRANDRSRLARYGAGIDKGSPPRQLLSAL